MIFRATPLERIADRSSGWAIQLYSPYDLSETNSRSWSVTDNTITTARYIFSLEGRSDRTSFLAVTISGNTIDASARSSSEQGIRATYIEDAVITDNVVSGLSTVMQ